MFNTTYRRVVQVFYTDIHNLSDMLQYATDIIADMHIDLPTSEEAYRDDIR